MHERGAIVIHNIHEYRRHLKTLLSNKISFVKILHDDIGFDPELLKDMISYAHDIGMKVSCHAYTNKAATEAVVAGADILEHAGDYDDTLLIAIKESGVIVVPTFATAYDSTYENCVDLTDINSGILRTWLEGEKKVIPKMLERGIPLALGSDAGFYCFPMDYLHREIELLREIFGMSMQQLLYSAFVTTPQCLCMENKLGRIAPHYYADFLVYKENPINNFAILRTPSQVWIGGNKVVDITQNVCQLRRLSSTDIMQVATFLSHDYFNCGKLNDCWSLDELVAWISNLSDYSIGAFLNEELIGFCLSHLHIESHKVHLENIFVKQEYRRRGIARQMLDEMIKYYSAMFHKVRFVGLVDTNNISSINLLKDYGFTIGSKMLWMQRNIFTDEKNERKLAT
jgi:ribosomal protein S18 acetylase RimI-like enzyme